MGFLKIKNTYIYETENGEIINATILESDDGRLFAHTPHGISPIAGRIVEAPSGFIFIDENQSSSGSK